MPRQFPLLIIAILAAGLSSCRKTYDPPEPAPLSGTAANTSLAQLRSMYNNGVRDLPAETVIGGIVTTSDSAGNFYQSLIIQQDTYGVELWLGTYDLYTSYRRGSQVALRAGNLRLGLYNGMLRVGAPGAGSASWVDPIGAQPLVSRLLVRVETTLGVAPQPVTIAQINTAMTGRLVRLSGGSFAEGGWAPWSGEHNYTAAGQNIIVYTSPYATFADDILPPGEVTLTGIVCQYNNKLQLRLSSSDDCSRTQ